jgi:hypothetical protein
MVTPKYIYDDLLVLDTEPALIELFRRKYFNIATAAKMYRRSLMISNPYLETERIDDIHTVWKFFADAKTIAAHGSPQYTFFRDGGNLTSFTTNQRLLTPQILDEYLRAYRSRTEYLMTRFPAIREPLQYFEWSFMLSMCEKVLRFGLLDCRPQFDRMQREIAANRDTLLRSPHIQAFEKEWIKVVLEEKQ